MSWTVTAAYKGAAVSDADALAYLRAVETADGQALEPAVATAVNDFVLGCKADGIWNAIKASCILAGARTLNGALVPLVGTAPTNFSFVGANYNRKTGLISPGTGFYLDSGRQANADPADSFHVTVYATQANVSGYPVGGDTASTGRNEIEIFGTYNVRGYARGVLTTVTVASLNIGLMGVQRNGGTAFTMRFNNANFTGSSTLTAATSENINIFRRFNPLSNYTNGRLAFYSIGESLDLAKLDSRVTALITAFGTAIP